MQNKILLGICYLLVCGMSLFIDHQIWVDGVIVLRVACLQFSYFYQFFLFPLIVFLLIRVHEVSFLNELLLLLYCQFLFLNFLIIITSSLFCEKTCCNLPYINILIFSLHEFSFQKVLIFNINQMIYLFTLLNLCIEIRLNFSFQVFFRLKFKFLSILAIT